MKKIAASVLLTLFIFSSCKKYLDEKPDKRLNVPESLPALQSILDNVSIINQTATVFNNNSSDEYFLTDDDWNGLVDYQKDGYVWAPSTVTPDDNSNDWTDQYRNIFYTNTVLDNLKRVSSKGQEQKWNDIKGQALFLRAYYFFELAQIYAKQYDPNNAHSEDGIVLRLNSDQNQLSERATLLETYDQIVNDLGESVKILDNSRKPSTKENKTRVTRAASFGLLARAYLQMGDYANARNSADSCLNLYSTLMDYNTVPDVYNPFSIYSGFTPETIFYSSTFNAVNGFDWMAKVDSNLYNSYPTSDLRKGLYFEDNGFGSFAFEGSYTGLGYELFTGIATDEIYLIRAEVKARMNEVSSAMDDLNILLQNRMNPFVATTATSVDDAVNQILQERRKELINRGLRWSDLKRLNKDSGRVITLKRIIYGQEYLLPPNDLRYSFLIPPKVVSLTGIPQNPR